MNLTMHVDWSRAVIRSLCVNDQELIAEQTPLFAVEYLNEQGERTVFDAAAATGCTVTDTGAVYTGFPNGIAVEVTATDAEQQQMHIHVTGAEGVCLEWVEFPRMILKPLVKNGGIGRMLLPYNEGVLSDDAIPREENGEFCHAEALYPSKGAFAVFPNMIFAQFMAYLTDQGGLYIGAHDEARGVKQIDYYPQGAGVAMQCKTFCGVDFGVEYTQTFPWVLAACGSRWEDAAQLYRAWLADHMPESMPRIEENPALPDWYGDSPLVITYPVRGIHDMDEMKPNALFPYCRALPLIDRIADRVGGRLLVLLMHWEGTAPWAPPYVWPPYGGEEVFDEFADALHDRGHCLGVYCSGFGYTEQSHLDDYSGKEKYEACGYERGMCASPEGEVQHSRICTGQRAGYDICPASEVGKEILDDAYGPLLSGKADYAQILDQNHGGGQYFCYSRDHGHPPVPGGWMTASMQSLLGGWNRIGGKMLLGCESAAAEPFIPHLLFSDNRFELNFHFGQAVPLYAFLYHEYVRNFMGNQVSCPFAHNEYTLAFRLAYAFAAGDALTLVMTPDGQLMTSWGDHDFTGLPDYDRTLAFVAALRRFYQEQAKPFLFSGRMLLPLEYTCGITVFHHVGGREIPVRNVLSTAWEKDGRRVQIFVNHTGEEQCVTIGDTVFTVPAFDACLREYDSLL